MELRDRFYEMGVGLYPFGRFIELIGIGAFASADHQHQIHLTGQLARLRLPFFGHATYCIKNNRVCTDLFEIFLTFFPLCRILGGLSHANDRLIGQRKAFDLLGRGDHEGMGIGIADDSLHLGMAPIPEDHKLTLAVLRNQTVDLFDVGTGHIADLEKGVLPSIAVQLLADTAGHTVGADDHRAGIVLGSRGKKCGKVVGGDHPNAPLGQLTNDMGIVDQTADGIDPSASLLLRQAINLMDGPLHAEAKAGTLGNGDLHQLSSKEVIREKISSAPWR